MALTTRRSLQGAHDYDVGPRLLFPIVVRAAFSRSVPQTSLAAPLEAAHAAENVGLSSAAGDDEDVPFVIPAPSSLEELESLLSGHTPETTSTILTRIRACTAISLSPDNRGKLQARVPGSTRVQAALLPITMCVLSDTQPPGFF